MEDWPSIVPPPQVIAAAIRRQRYGDAVKPNNLENYASLEVRAEGFVAEMIFEAWLQHRGVPYVHHGGPDYLPDFEIGGQGIAVRCCGSLGAFTPRHTIYVFDTHLRSAPQRFFLGCERHAGRYVLLGGCSTEQFRTSACFAEQGEEVVRGFVASYPLWHTRVSMLAHPIEWLATLTATVAV